MYVYNITFGIEREIEQEWLQWVRSKYVPDVMQKGDFVSHKIYKVLNEEQEGAISYCLQFYASTLDAVAEYLEENRITEVLHDEFKDRHVAFRTLLEELD